MSKKIKLILKLLSAGVIICAVFFAGMRIGKTKKDAQQEVNKITYIKNANNEEILLPKKFENEREKKEFYDSLGIKSKICFNYKTEDKYIPAEEVFNFTVNGKIYDVSFMAYSKEFAEKYGYPEKYIYPLDKGVSVMEFKLITEGRNSEAYLNVLLDKDLGIDVPTISYVMRESRRGIRFRLPDKLKYYREPDDMKEARLKAQKEPGGWVWENYYSRNICLATMDYKPLGPGRWTGGGRVDASLVEYSNNYFKGYDYFSIRLSSEEGTWIILNQKDPSIWLKKIGGADYSMKLVRDPNEFVKIKIPVELAKKIIPILQEKEMYNFSNVIERYRRSKEANVSK